MPPPEKDLIAISNDLLQPHGLQVTSCKILQNLWAGYGVICRITTNTGTPLILKYVSPPTSKNKTGDEGHIRKVISYQVEKHFYEQLAGQMPKSIAVAKWFGSCAVGEGVALILQDLSGEFGIAGEKRGTLRERQVHAAVRWLGGFHGFWWGRTKEWEREELRRAPLEEVQREKQGEGFWLNGGYTYLATRRKEFAGLMEEVESEWEEKLCRPMAGDGESVAEIVARVIAPSENSGSGNSIREFETLIHGDVKSENLFTTKSGDEVAFFDFQYVGLGLGVCDLAKLFTCSVPQSMLTEGEDIADELDMGSGERSLLDEYREIVDPCGNKYPPKVLERHWQTALVDWLRFQASWGFWGNTEWLEARVRAILKDEGWRSWVLAAVESKS